MTAATTPAPTSAQKPSKQAGPKARKAAPKPPEPKAPKPDAPGQSAGVGLGQQLLDAAGLNAKARAIATKLSKDQPVNHRELVTLRDQVKASAAALRERNKDKDARELARLNRYVRRLERAAR